MTTAPATARKLADKYITPAGDKVTPDRRGPETTDEAINVVRAGIVAREGDLGESVIQIIVGRSKVIATIIPPGHVKPIAAEGTSTVTALLAALAIYEAQPKARPAPRRQKRARAAT